MLFTMFVLFLFGWLFFHSIGLALHLTWCAAKVIAALLFAVALPVLLVCLFVAGGLLLLVPLGLIGAAFGILKFYAKSVISPLSCPQQGSYNFYNAISYL